MLVISSWLGLRGAL